MKIRPEHWRSYSTLNHVLSAKAVRKRFLEYFVNENGHEWIKSSPVLPQFDPSIPFVNAGMCQFKTVFTGDDQIEFGKAANTQKCIRIGGKHNDLNLVGLDSFHHTFFEMLGNWSFGSYGKKEACQLAWDLLTKPPYSVAPHKLFITYFGGDNELNLPPDEEVKEIWKELGVLPERIIPFGLRENFWEMGLTGPCGTCSEIHAALTDDLCLRPDLVNRNNPLLAELWNIVFIKYKKTEDSIERLPQEFIDTGMGFERLVSMIQQKSSNYDTDLFQPLFATIEKVCKAPKYAGTFQKDNLDVAYRCLADFSRMITVAITDNVFPDTNAKLRKILRKALFIARSDFKQSSPEHLLHELSQNVIESLHETFPEVGLNSSQVKLIIDDEAILVNNMINENAVEWNSAKTKYPVLQNFNFVEYPGLPRAYEYLVKQLAKSDIKTSLPAEKVYYMYYTFGLDRPILEKITAALNLSVSWDEAKSVLDDAKVRSRKSLSDNSYEGILRRVGIKTDDSYKHHYYRTDKNGAYSFPEVEARILAIVQGNKIVSIDLEREKVSEELKSALNAEISITNEETGLILSKTNFICENKRGRRFDKGVIIIDGNVRLMVYRVKKFADFMVHYVQKVDSEGNDITLQAGILVTLQLDNNRRLNIMRNNLLSHLAFAALKNTFPLLYFQYDNSEDIFMNLRICVHGKEPDLRDCSERVVEFIRNCISQKLNVEKMMVSSGLQAYKLPGLSLRPGMIYPAKNIELITVKDEHGNIIFREPCSDVHIVNTSDLHTVQITNLAKVGFNILTVTMAAGDVAQQVVQFEDSIRTQTQIFENERMSVMSDLAENDKIIEVSETLSAFILKLMNEHWQKEDWFTFNARDYMNSMIQFKCDMDKKVAQLPEESVVKYVKSKMLEQAKNKKFAIYCSTLNVKAFKFKSFVMDLVNLEQFPSLLFTYSEEKLKGVCHVPENFVNDNFNAKIWLELVLKQTPSHLSFTVQEDDGDKNYCFLRTKFVDPKHLADFFSKYLETGENIAKNRINL